VSPFLKSLPTTGIVDQWENIYAYAFNKSIKVGTIKI